MVVTYELLDGTATRGHFEELRELYGEVYAEPPYLEGPEHVASFSRHLTRELDLPGFRLALATHDGQIIGAAYGFTLSAGEWMEPSAEEPPAHIRDIPKFNVAEWMVRSPFRGGGIGRRLLDMLLAERSEAWAVLASNPAAPARRIYERWGWKPHGRIEPKTMPSMDVLALPLTERGKSTGGEAVYG